MENENNKSIKTIEDIIYDDVDQFNKVSYIESAVKQIEEKNKIAVKQ